MITDASVMEIANSREDGLMPHCSNGASLSDEGEQPHPIVTRASELTISFEGEVYVFPSVTPQKVPFFLLSFYLQFIIIVNGEDLVISL